MRVLVRSMMRKGGLDARAVAGFCAAVMRAAGFSASAELSVLVVGAGGIRRLNRAYRGVDRATDVLSFPLGKGGGMVGDVVVSLDAARREARRRGTTVSGEVRLYLVHGILHLCGHDDRTSRGRAQMESLQEEILRKVMRKGTWNVTGSSRVSTAR